MSFIGAGLSLAPWKLVTAKSSIQRFRLPPASVHIPHGNFASSEVKKLIVSEFELECSVNHFLRNGITICENDLTVYSFQRGEELLQISYTENEESFNAGNIEGLKISLDSRNRDFFLVTKT